MKNKIPTAEEFFNNKGIFGSMEERLSQYAIEFAKLHVEAALENAAENGKVRLADVIKEAIEYGYQLRCNHKPINSGIDWVKEFINSLNKQD